MRRQTTPPRRSPEEVPAFVELDAPRTERASWWRAPRSVSRRQAVVGSVSAVAMVIGLGAAMFPLRGHLSIATTALILVIPVVIAVAIGGVVAGIVATAAGFLVYDFIFIPPYNTLYVGAAENWVALVVYVIVTIVIAQVVARMNAARREARLRAAEVRRLFDLSELLVRESSMPDLLTTIVETVRRAFDLDSAALLLPVGEGLELVATSGAPLSELELHQVSVDRAVPVSLEAGVVQRGGIQAVALVASGRGIGLLALRGSGGPSKDSELLRAFANHLALALERAELGEYAVRAQLLEEVDRLRRSLLGAVSHDLRTPLATIKVSASTLVESSAKVTGPDIRKLGELIVGQADRLERLVSNVLDMTRIQSGALELRRQPTAVADLVDEALSVLGSLAELERVQWQAPADLPLVDVDHVLICQVLANLIDNATRYAPGDTQVTISARHSQDGAVEVAVADRGPGVPANERTSIFQMFNRREAGGRGGLGLAIAQVFVEAHGQRIWIDESDGPGARFVFTLPLADASAGT
jgi:two-component system sensor histidine kinase KdpD